VLVSADDTRWAREVRNLEKLLVSKEWLLVAKQRVSVGFVLAHGNCSRRVGT
jgi:hypothetical protein